MGLAGVNEIDRPLVGDKDGGQPVKIIKNQIGSLVGGKTPGKAEGEDPGLQSTFRVFQVRKVVGGINPGREPLPTMLGEHAVEVRDQDVSVFLPGCREILSKLGILAKG